jgi:hypothetical protein
MSVGVARERADDRKPPGKLGQFGKQLNVTPGVVAISPPAYVDGADIFGSKVSNHWAYLAGTKDHRLARDEPLCLAGRGPCPQQLPQRNARIAPARRQKVAPPRAFAADRKRPHRRAP